MRLMALVVVALLPMGALSLWSAFSASQSALEQARDQLKLAASLVAAQQDRRADAAEHLLAVITAVPEIRSLDRERCQAYMETLRGRYPIYGNIGILDLKGDLICHAADRQGRFNAADRLYFREAIKTRQFAMGELVVGRTIKRPVITFALPVIEHDTVQAVAFAGLDVAQMQLDLDQLPLPPGARLAVLDEQGRLIIERDADGLPVRPPGTPVTATELREAARSMQSGYVQASGRDGRKRLIAFAPAEPVGRGRLLAIASLDVSGITSVAWERARRELLVLALVLVASLAAAGWMGRRMIIRPADELEAQTRQLAQLGDDLRQSNRELEAFSYSVSHDLRAPLAAMEGFSRALEDRLPADADPKVLHYVSRIRAGAHHMEELIEGLLQLARLGREPLHVEAVDLSALAQEALEWLRVQAPGREVTARVQPGLVAQGDVRMLRTVIQNLLGNAWKFTEPCESPLIDVGCEAGAEGLVFYVRDNGVGFDMAHASRLFTPFQRLHTASEFPGTGIGLATVQRVVERHGGRIWALAAPGEGCTVYFTLPGAAAPEAPLLP